MRFDRSLALWLMRPSRERKIRGSIPACVVWCFPHRVIPVTSKLALRWLPFQAPGIIGSALGLVGPVPVYCDWVRWKVWSATSVSVRQHMQLSEQIRPWDNTKTIIMMMMIIIIIIIMMMMMMIALKGIIRDCLQSSHCAANCLQHARSGDQGAVVRRSCATHRALITCNMSCATWYEGTAHHLSLTDLKSHLF